MMAKTIDETNIDALFENMVASNTSVNTAASTNIESKEINLSFRNEDGILVPDDTFGDDTCHVVNNVSISKDKEKVSLNTSKY